MEGAAGQGEAAASAGAPGDREFPTGLLLVGDAVERLRGLPDRSFGACVTDPPYHLTEASRRVPRGAGGDGRRGFMDSEWDGGDVAFRPETWAEVLRVLKPGAHLAAFGGPRTFHRLVSAIEDGGFVIVDAVAWVNSQGMPKSFSVAGEIDRAFGADAGQWGQWVASRREALGWSRAELAAEVGASEDDVAAWEGGGGPVLPSAAHRRSLVARIGYPGSDPDAQPRERYRKGDGTVYDLRFHGMPYPGPASDAAAEWDGWGTALKGSLELICVARRPLEGTTAANVVRWGTGGLNVDGCRVGHDDVVVNTWDDGAKPFGGGAGHPYTSRVSKGRFPPNVVLSHHRQCVEVGERRVRAGSGSGDRSGEESADRRYDDSGATQFAMKPGRRLGDAAGMETVAVWACVPDCPVRLLDDRPLAGGGDPAEPSRYSRFFPVFADEPMAAVYCKKAGPDERPVVVGDDGDETRHATVKPLALIRWLTRLLCPPSETVLDPFLGSGTLAEAASLEGVRWAGVELCDGSAPGMPDHTALIKARLDRFARGMSPGMPRWARQEAAGQQNLFG